MNPQPECSVRTCRNPADGGFKMCKRCRDAEAQRSQRKREKRRADRLANGETIRTRAPNRPKPPLYRIQGPDTGFKLYTERNWEHLDEGLFRNEVGTELPQSEYDGAVPLIPIKVCSRKGCHQPVPAAHPGNICGFCSRRNPGSSKAIDKVQHQRANDSNLLDKLGVVLEQLASLNSDNELEIVQNLVNVLNETPISALVGALVHLLDDHPKAEAALAVLELVAERTKYPFSTELDILLPKLFHFLHDGTFEMMVRYMLIVLFSNDSVWNAATSQLDQALSCLITLSEGISRDRSAMLAILDDPTNDDVYRHQFATTISPLVELIGNSRLSKLETWIVIHILLNLSDDTANLRDIAPAVPRLIELSNNQVISYEVVLILSRLSNNEDSRTATMPALPLITQALCQSKDGRTYPPSLKFIANHCSNPSSVDEIRTVVLRILTLSYEARAEEIRDEAVNTLITMKEKGADEGYIIIPTLMKAMFGSPTGVVNRSVQRALELWKDEEPMVVLTPCD